MQKNLPNVAVFVLLAVGLGAGWWYVDRTFFPKPEPVVPEPPPPPRETVLALAGSMVNSTKPAAAWPMLAPYVDPKPVEVAKPPTPPPAPTPSKPADPPTLYVLGDDSFYQRVVLTNKGAGVQQVALRSFKEANRLGLEVKHSDGTPQQLRVIPGVERRSRTEVSLTDIHNDPDINSVPDLPAGTVSPALQRQLTEPSYLLLHYPADGDPKKGAKDADRMNDRHPSPELGDRLWTLVGTPGPDAVGNWTATFETTLDAPYHLKLRKTYSLAPKEYHVNLKLDIEPLPGRPADKTKFRYQIVGARHLPIEGEWYTAAYRNAMAGVMTKRGGVRRTIEDSGSVQNWHGGDESRIGADEVFSYAAVATQYFASALVIDEQNQPWETRRGLWEYVRATREPSPDDVPEQPAMSDVTVRAVANPVEIGAKPVSHAYLIYTGPVKVQLLDQLTGEEAVSEELVDRYLFALSLKSMTDYHSPNFFGRLANAIWWSDLVITFTNLMHMVLGFIGNTLGLPWGVSIIVLTVMVRLMLLIPSRKQQIMMARMQEKMAAMKPEMDKLQEKYKDNPQLLQQEKTRLMLRSGVNPLSTMSGCLLMFAQMPVFMGLYFCLQESVFFRLEPFLWAPNLAAPDMLVWWSEGLPFVSNPANIGSAVYLGPYFNVLPILAVSLIFVQQKLTMPPPTSEEQEMQQKMMKYMILFMAVFFYKMPSGLALYFICSTLWGLAERKLIPKPKTKPNLPIPPASGTTNTALPGTTPPDGAPSGGGFISRMKAKLEDMQRQADDQARRQIRNEPNSPRPGGGGGGKKDKKKKRGK